MKNARTKRFRLLVVLLGFVLLAAACAADAPDPPVAGEDDTPVEDDTPAEEDPPTEPAGPVMLALTPDPFGTEDPLETINHLQSVYVSRTETGVAVQFNQMNNGGLRVIIQDQAAGVDVFCDMYDSGDGSLASTCSGFNARTGEYLPTVEIPLLDVTEGYAFDVPLTVDEDFVSIALGGTTYRASVVRVADEPGFVRINQNTGLLADPVVRDVGFATAGELLAALA